MSPTANPNWDRTRLIDLVGLLCDERITDAEFAELSQLLEAHPDARPLYQMCIATHLRIEHGGGEGLAKPNSNAPLGQRRPAGKAPIILPAPIPDSSLHVPRSAFHISQLFFRPATFWSLLGFVVVGMLAIVFWTTKTHGPGPVANVPTGPAATLANSRDAKWHNDFAPAGNSLAAGERLKLESGSAEVKFNGKAQVIFEAPAEFTIVDAGACRLANGKLTAHVPQPARGFKVITPDGTVTDLGTDFGVLVSGQLSVVSGNKNSEPMAASRQPTATSTEVHVFLGQVALSDANQLLQAPTDPTSTIPHPPSTILKAGQAATITANEVKPLPAADPFKFRPEAFDSRARKTLLADDFEALTVGTSGRLIGQWKTAYATKDEIHVVDPAAGAAGVPSPLPPVGHRAMEVRNDRRKTKDINPFASAKLDVQQVPARCRLLLECDICPRTQDIEPSILLTGKSPLRLAPSVSLGREPDPAAVKIVWEVNQWYRVRAAWNVVDGALHEMTFERQAWRGADGWVRDVAIALPAPQVPEKLSGQVWLGFPAPLAGAAGGTFWLDNVKVEVLAEK
ncbi:MAG: FecR family protein [Planctomycetia bacterium]|nr:FecR family protein [Planctomycetia bacterium]